MGRSITLIPGDGVGPEIVGVVRKVIEATGLKIDWEVCEAGKTVFEKGIASGVPAETIASLKRTKVGLKGPLETPVGYGGKSANVTLRTLFGTYANVRPSRSIPGLPLPFKDRSIDFVIVRENLEDLYAGIEYLQTPSVAEALKIITYKGSAQIIRFAFELALAEGRSTVHCATKANILKLTEGLFKRTFEEIAKDYPHINARHIIIDNCANQLVQHPEMFDVIVTTNLHGDILSDLAAGLIGGLGLAPAANIGPEVSIFEAVHGSAPDIAGTNTANPVALLLSSILLLRHIGEMKVAETIEQALLYTLSVEKSLPRDLSEISTLTTSGFGDRVISHFGKTTSFFPSRAYSAIRLPQIPLPPPPLSRQEIGVDIYLESLLSPHDLGTHLESITQASPFNLTLISNRGVQVYPLHQDLAVDLVDHYRVRFLFKEKKSSLTNQDILDLIKTIGLHYPWMHIEKLNEFDHTPGFTKAQGED